MVEEVEEGDELRLQLVIDLWKIDLREWEEPKSQYKSSCQSYKSIAIRNEITTQIPGYSMVFHV
jgi:hypothetical protein